MTRAMLLAASRPMTIGALGLNTGLDPSLVAQSPPVRTASVVLVLGVLVAVVSLTWPAIGVMIEQSPSEEIEEVEPALLAWVNVHCGFLLSYSSSPSSYPMWYCSGPVLRIAPTAPSWKPRA